jgi:hypothetical protein
MRLSSLFLGLAIGVGGILAASYLLDGQRILMMVEPLGPKPAIAIEETLGELYYSIRQYERASFYFQLLMKEYPEAPEAETAFFYAIECMRFGNLISSADMVSHCTDYLNRYPDGEHAAMIRAIGEVYAKRVESDIDVRAVGLKAGVSQLQQL